MRTILIFLLVIAIYSTCFFRVHCEGATGLSSSGPASKKLHGFNPTASRLYRLLRAGIVNSVDDEDLQSDDDNFVQKRQYDDYGHMRFGKRNPSAKDFDDYGHLRFGK